MALVIIDGCEDLSSLTSGLTPSIVAGRHGNAFQFSGTFNVAYATLAPAFEADTATVGFAFRYTALPGAASQVFSLYSDNGTFFHVQLRIDTNGAFQIVNGASTVLGSTIAAVIPLSTWAYVELQAKMHATTGFFTLRVNGVTVASATNVNTKTGGTKTTFDTYAFQTQQNTGTVNWDDFYLMTGTGDSFLGDITVETLYPNGNGNANQWLGSDADSVNNYLLVNETGTPVTTTYTGDSVSGHQDLYTLTDLVATTGTVLGVCHSAYAAKSDALNTRQVKLVNRRAADNKSAALTLTTTYTPLYYALATDPETSAPFTIANVNALQSGIEVV